MTWAHPSAILAQTGLPALQMCSFSDRHFFAYSPGGWTPETKVSVGSSQACGGHLLAVSPQGGARAPWGLHTPGSMSGLQSPTFVTLSKRAPPKPRL